MNVATAAAAKPPTKPAAPKTKAPAKAKAPIKKEKPEGVMSVPELAALLSKGRKERVKKSFIRKTLDAAEWPKRDGKRYFLPNEVEKAKKLIIDALKGE